VIKCKICDELTDELYHCSFCGAFGCESCIDDCVTAHDEEDDDDTD